MTFLQMNELILPKLKAEKDVWEDYVKYKNNLYSREFSIDEIKDINLIYPGKKTWNRENGSIVYDYLVNCKGNAISHAEIVVDLYNKVIQQPASKKQSFADELKDFLTVLARDGEPPGLTVNLISSNDLPPTKDLLAKTKTSVDYNISFEDLSLLIPWISLQEDINYPMNKGYQGRKMSFYRYFESIHSATAAGQKEISVFEVINRTKNKGQKPPDFWPTVNYDSIRNLTCIPGNL